MLPIAPWTSAPVLPNLQVVPTRLQAPTLSHDSPYQLVLLRHGESEWNKKNLFTGWRDVKLTEQGEREAREGGRAMAAEGLAFDIAYTSLLGRAIKTLWLSLEEMDRMWLPVIKH